MSHISYQSIQEQLVFEIAKKLIDDGKEATIDNVAFEIETNPAKVADDFRDLYHNGFIDFDPMVPVSQWKITAVHEISTIY